MLWIVEELRSQSYIIHAYTTVSAYHYEKQISGKKDKQKQTQVSLVLKAFLLKMIFTIQIEKWFILEFLA